MIFTLLFIFHKFGLICFVNLVLIFFLIVLVNFDPWLSKFWKLIWLQKVVLWGPKVLNVKCFEMSLSKVSSNDRGFCVYVYIAELKSLNSETKI